MSKKEKIKLILSYLERISDRKAIKVAYDLKTIATGLYFRLNCGAKWHQIPSGVYSSYTVFQYWLEKLKQHGFLPQIERIVKK